jgi:hypothetical protein
MDGSRSSPHAVAGVGPNHDELPYQRWDRQGQYAGRGPGPGRIHLERGGAMAGPPMPDPLLAAAPPDPEAMSPYPPDPYPHDRGDGTIFDPDRPRFRDVPLVTLGGRGTRLVRGYLPKTVSSARLLEAAAALGALPGEIFGVLANALGDLVLAEPGVDFGYDVRFEREIVLSLQVPPIESSDEILHALDDISESVREARAELDRTSAAGWRLFHVECGLTTRISCYDPHFPH